MNRAASRLLCTCQRRRYATIDSQEAIIEHSGGRPVQGDDGPERISTGIERSTAAPDYESSGFEQATSAWSAEQTAPIWVPPELKRGGNPAYSTWFPPPERTDKKPAWAKSRSRIGVPTLPPSRNRAEVARVRLHAYTTDKSRLLFFTDFAQRASDALGIPTRLEGLPTDIQGAAMNAGPFGDAKTKTFYWRRTHRRELVAFNAPPSVVQSWFEYLRRTIMPGIGLRLQTTSYHPLGFGKDMTRQPQAVETGQQAKGAEETSA